MAKRFISIWFLCLETDWHAVREPSLARSPFVLTAPDHGRQIITAANAQAMALGIEKGMVLADARACFPAFAVKDEKPGLSSRLLTRMAQWCIRFTPVATTDMPDGLLLDVSGCSHLWGGEESYVTEIYNRFKQQGYTTRIAMADTVGTAWAMARFGKNYRVIAPGTQMNALLSLPPEALRLPIDITEQLHKLGLCRIEQFIGLPRNTLSRRFGQPFIHRLQQALGEEEENIQGIELPMAFRERLPCLEPIITATGIEIALRRLLETLCNLLTQEGQGLRTAHFKGYRTDGKITEITISTCRPSTNAAHLFKLFTIQIGSMDPGAGIELFVLEAPLTEPHLPAQQKLWGSGGGLTDSRIAELVDRIRGRTGRNSISRYIPDEHYWPEHSFKTADSLAEEPQLQWPSGGARPLHLLSPPEPVEVTAPIPDYPPMLFRYKGKLHVIKKADGPERIEQEWWLRRGQHRDYYAVEDEEGSRYWIFRLGHYDASTSYKWFIHGFFS